ncbi:carboxylating nicotinate-nucleotide diphosphorylase [Cupriavidus necator]|uniref:Probable nicotinate-nucleotide pyrophosphorylase [carboxylating] n=1 Tax=Cupriavidus necator (strain ATCC 17699 / DSM 428 / KCTC 22496 / NCIMB 10442 / H16 / Stanier 337) TaxID=381666 RepID=Q0K7A9_CUPNH|nr:carboxylating nicotinate-nucleotide diphosphorylase [Cupriavidus necator]QCC01875.1 carboxylating nicotinate-nucleotide diphosphorylase [Cupriavidus necator H16]QQB75293.1 carboxylating nicotinate-nucleotide diphosphorylase [Cupriavidus necator]WKA40277.1 carboxylating nicotinate-nucleotide diphosphorylase [Cupriavidus necator]CAJ94112.1 quinolinate phosphoribosyl transferase [Cupriavidus necator H16]
MSVNSIFDSYGPALQAALQANVQAAIDEDVGSGDLTGLLVPAAKAARARVIVRESAVLCGQPWFDACMRALDPALEVHWLQQEGARMAHDSVVCEITGPARSLLTAERPSLNFLQLLSGVATATRRYADLIAGTRARVLDTRKTLPGLRLAQKYAVRIGGGENQRLALYDGILIKENHIAAAGSISAAMQAALALDTRASVQIEVETLAELEEALAAGAKSVLIDNFTVPMMQDAVRINRGRALLEVSGGVNADTIRTFAETGVDRISVGALTKDVRATDYSLRIIG